MNKTKLRVLIGTLLVSAVLLVPIKVGAQDRNDPISLSMRNTEISEVMAMLSKIQRVNILLSEEVGGEVSFNLYDVPLDQAIQSIANAGGYAVERRNGTYFIVSREEAGIYGDSDLTQVQTYKIQYADPALVEGLLRPYLSNYGEITALPERNLLVVEDKPSFLRRIRAIIEDVDHKPKQILIEAKILEITLNNEDSYGIDWSNFFSSQDGEGSFGTRGLAGAGDSSSSGFVFDVTNSDFSGMLTALEEDGRVRTLSTPKLLALDGQEASVIVGDRRGYQVTTTINQVTTESIEFLESGVILRVTPKVDGLGRVLMDIHPEVSTGVVDANGIPSQTTTEVTTQLLVSSGQTIFVGGLIKHTLSETRKGVPVLGRVPGLGRLFSSREQTNVNTETIVLITPSLVDSTADSWNQIPADKVEKAESVLDEKAATISTEVDQTFQMSAWEGAED
ncbi:MAG: secretin N-terminal domain-containing protein [Pseudomonadota bacterium]